MKKKIVFLVSLFTIVAFITVCCNESNTSDLHKVEKIEGVPNFFKSQNFYFAGQPSAETFKSLKEDGVGLVINLRSISENTKQAKDNFDEEELVKSLGMKYASIPMSGSAAYCPETVEKIAKAIETGKGKILIHCAGCGRVTHVWMAYLIRHCNFSVDEAIAVGRQLKFVFYLEDLLGEKITMDLIK